MNLQHHFLIAMPSLSDPYFNRSVVYICEHDQNGAMGLVINKPIAQISIQSLLENLDITPEDRDDSINLNKPVMAGGPLSEEHGFILHTPQSGFSSSIQISDETMITTSKDVLEALGTPRQPENVLMTLGYSSWEKGQLEQEIMENSWLTVSAESSIIFDTPVADRWHEAASLLGINIYNLAPQAGHA
ncbi:YqgE/AlgH family protein [Xenorhabdus bovienii]|uniref:YqgE/AlgH family protein n=1 Tax=Xenorhabdus bovienii TaxID=40576 RepID=UPI00237C549D|nr:YqgE/AlgH family protein [Xenorhabdus bovienii]MDE1485493.1 YqgE/AlgH family protein [Xenorhabdus bovienii]MDE1494006.1 YqgE/AlgH family protein [Xenorhabdus bovienii]MDE9429949.1 YqgE/AlgH family protein [Xenorhabdus bovienii]MDE9459014.1 YqgE/AlgH family protein [Xenorhabdus bovienii]MDE9472084.1 YqgE/AlgH family protein [Xenorhabdus bovienii]